MAALTLAERAQVRLYLGWASRFYQSEPRLEQAMNALDQADEAERSIVRGMIGDLQDIDDKITAAQQRLAAEQVGSIKLPGMIGIGMLRSEGRRHVGRLSALLGVSPEHDVFSGSAPGGSNALVTC